MKKLIRLITLLFTIAPLFLQGQQIPEDRIYAERYSYRSAENPWYWKNKMPRPGYWQQDVAYTIDAVVDDATDIVDGHLELTYYNNSPDALKYVYFHLYQEAFQPGSYAHQLNVANNNVPEYGNYEAQGLGTEVEKIHIVAINGFPTSKEVLTEQDNTILRVNLPEALQPNGSMTFSIDFSTYFDIGGLRRRMKLFEDAGAKHYDGVHWYPRICVYDQKFGWTTDQHLGKEFYGDFGSFDVRLTFPDHYIVGATGTLINPEEAMPSGLRSKLDISNFANKPWGSAPSTIIPITPGATKTWHFKAVNTHDFAFTADPTYRIGEKVVNVDGRLVLIQALAQEQHATGWQNAADYTGEIITTFSRDFGAYIWPKIIVADARDGMEYPMLTLDGGFDPYYRDLLIHEVGHMWFFGMLGNNETYRAFLDEGFTQFITAWGYRAIDGDTAIVYPEKSAYRARFKKPDDVLFTENYYGYLRDAVRSNDPGLNTHSDHFGSALGHGGGYGHVYYKTAVMLHNLEYVLGEDLFLAAMQHYVEQWKVAHPYPEDFRNSIIQYTGVDLNWFFDQWLETNKNIDYAVQKVKKGKVGAAVTAAAIPLQPYTITLERKGSMQMPVDFIVTTKEGDTMRYYIPNGWFEKEVNEAAAPEGRVNRLALEQVNTLPRWIGWDKLNPTYTAEVLLPGKLDEVIIDPSLKMADVNRLNNSNRLPLIWQFDSKVRNWPDPYHYTLNWRPDVWYNEIDGIKAGMHLSGNYFNFKHIFSLSVWANTGIAQGGFYNFDGDGQGTNDGGNYEPDPFSVNFSYKTATDRILHGTDLVLKFRYLDGILGGQAGFEHRFGDNNKELLRIYAKSFKATNTDYQPGDISGEWNNSLNLEWQHTYRYQRGKGTINSGLRTTLPGGPYNFSRLNMEAVNENRLGKFDLKTRVFLQGGSAIADAPGASMLYLAGANPEEYLDNKYIRSYGWVPNDWFAYGGEVNHFQFGGGLNLRGYAGYTIAQEGRDGNIYVIERGTSGGSFNAELAFNRLFSKQPINGVKLVPYLFADAGTLVYTEENGDQFLTDLRADAGLGMAVSINKWGVLDNIKPLTIRADFPVWVNRPSFVEEDYFKFRWVIGLERAF